MSFDVTRTTKPSTVVFSDLENGQFFCAKTRTGDAFPKTWMSVVLAAAADVIAFDKQVQSIPARFGPMHMVKIRSVFIDDKSGTFAIKLDYLHDTKEQPAYNASDIQTLLGDGQVKYDGQPHNIEVRIREALFGSDYFAPLGDDYYEDEF